MEKSVGEEIGFKEIYDFLAHGWKVILVITLIGTGIGGVRSLGLPDQFEAKGLIQTGKVVRTDSAGGVNSIEVESVEVLAEKLRSPTYYDSKTLAVCVNDGWAGGAEALSRAMSANVVQNSKFVSVSYRAESRDKAIGCLKQTLALVIENQKASIEASSSPVFSSLDKAKKKASELRKSVEQAQVNRDSQFEFKGAESGAILLIVEMLQSKIQQDLLDTEKEISIMEAMLMPPYIQEAKFLTPIFASEQRVSPHRTQVVMIGAMTGLFFGVLVVLLRSAFASVKQRLKSAPVLP